MGMHLLMEGYLGFLILQYTLILLCDALVHGGSKVLVLWHPLLSSIANVFCCCVALFAHAVMVDSVVSEHKTLCFIAAGFGAEDIGLQSNFRGPSGQQGPYGSSGEPSICITGVLCSLHCVISPWGQL